MRFGSVCSGIEAASVAWLPLGWRCAFVSEIEKFPCAVLSHHHPEAPNFGDMTKFKEWPDATIDLLVGGTPCQSFSVAGLRKGLDDPRGNLTLTYLAVAERYRPKWLVWENVPGVLSDGTGAFASFLGGLAELGYGFAYRILDAQFAGVPQRRRRVFVVGCLGDWRSAAAVLLERASLSGNPAPRREARERVAASLRSGASGGRSHGKVNGTDRMEMVPEYCADVSSVDARNKIDRGDSQHLERLVTHSLRAEGFDAGEDGTGRGIPLVCGTLSDGAHMGGGLTARTPIPGELSLCLNAGAMGRIDAESETLIPERTGGGFDGPVACEVADSQTVGANQTTGFVGDVVAFDPRQITSKTNRSNPKPGDPCHTLPICGEAEAPMIAFTQNQRDEVRNLEDVAGSLAGEPGMKQQTYIAIPHCEVMPTIRAAASQDGPGHGARSGDSKDELIVPAVAFDARQSDVIQYGDKSGPLDTDAFSIGVLQSSDASTSQAHTITLLRALRKEVGAEAFTEWVLGVFDSLQSQEVLRPEVYGKGVRREADESGRWVGDGSLSREERDSNWSLREMRQAGRERRSPQGRGLSEQLTGELDSALSQLSHEGASSEEFLLSLRFASEGLGLLQQALHPAQGRATLQVRRLTALECERLQGFPDSYTRIPLRTFKRRRITKTRPADRWEQCLDGTWILYAADGPRYKALGNSMAVPVMFWIGSRIKRLEELLSSIREAA